VPHTEALPPQPNAQWDNSAERRLNSVSAQVERVTNRVDAMGERLGREEAAGQVQQVHIDQLRTDLREVREGLTGAKTALEEAKKSIQTELQSIREDGRATINLATLWSGVLKLLALAAAALITAYVARNWPR
jgi:chromosome segregation ATPase